MAKNRSKEDTDNLSTGREYRRLERIRKLRAYQDRLMEIRQEVRPPSLLRKKQQFFR